MRDLEGLADVVVGVVSRAMSPVLERLAVAEAKLAQYATADQTIGELRERVVVAETKAALMRPETPLEDFLVRLAAVETKLAAERDIEPLARRVESLEHRPIPTPEEIVVVRERLTAVETKAAQRLPDMTEWVTGLESKKSIGPPPVAEETLTDIRKRIEALEQRPAPIPVTDDLNSLRDRVVAVETKSSVFESQLASPYPLVSTVVETKQAVADMAKDFAAMRERIAVVEVRSPAPGPKGDPGPPGKDGLNGTLENIKIMRRSERSFEFCFKDGTPIEGGLIKMSYPVFDDDFTFVKGKDYEQNTLVQWDGGGWVATRDRPSGVPGVGSPEQTGWKLFIKSGRNGKDGKDAPGALPVVTVGGGRG